MKRKTPISRNSLTAMLGGGLLVCGLSQGRALTVVDFETVPGSTPTEGLSISNQYTLSHGITFTLAGGTKPILAEVGAPRYAFTGYGGVDDTPAPGQNVGSFFLVDPTTPVQSGIPSDLLVSYSVPQNFVSGGILDIDGTEAWLIQALNASAMVIGSVSLNPGSPGAGDAIETTWSFSHASADIAGVRIHYNGAQTENIGYAWDNFTSTVPEPSTAALLALGILFWRGRCQRPASRA